MSVPLSKRKLSRYEFYDNAVRMRISITNLLLRDFGVKNKVRNVKFFSQMVGMSDEDTEAIERIAEKYNLRKSVLEEYPYWLIDHFRKNILDILKDLISNITAGQTVNEQKRDDCLVKRGYQTAAIINCEQLLQEFQYVTDILPCNYSKFLPYVDMIDNEIRYLRAWMGQTEKLLVKIASKQNIG